MEADSASLHCNDDALQQFFVAQRDITPTHGFTELMLARADKENTPNAAELRSRSARAKREYSCP